MRRLEVAGFLVPRHVWLSRSGRRLLLLATPRAGRGGAAAALLAAEAVRERYPAGRDRAGVGATPVPLRLRSPSRREPVRPAAVSAPEAGLSDGGSWAPDRERKNNGGERLASRVCVLKQPINIENIIKMIDYLVI